MEAILWSLVLVAEFLLGSSLALSVLRPERRVWPPPGRDSWQFWFVWLLIVFVYLGIAGLVVLDWNSFVFPDWLRYFVGLPLFAAGLFLAFSGLAGLGTHNSAGLSGEFVANGLYRYSRNPQYLGDILNLVGLALLSNVGSAVLPCLLGVLLYSLWPLSEEPWLRERFGAAYERYCRQVPRFL